MKKRSKFSLRTKIYLAIVAPLALTGILYAQFPPSHPNPFSSGAPVYPGFPSGFFPNGVAASPDFLLVTPYCDDNVISLDCNGAATVFATIPGFGSCREKYMTITPTQAEVRG